MREKYQSLIWSYLTITVSYSVLEYQVEVQHLTRHCHPPLIPFSPEEQGNLLLKAVEVTKPTEGGYCLIHFAACNYLNCMHEKLEALGGPFVTQQQEEQQLSTYQYFCLC